MIDLVYSNRQFDDNVELRSWADVHATQLVDEWHGTKFYNVWSISREGIKPSCDVSMGHDFHGTPGVFTGPTHSVSFSDSYSTPQNIFGNGIYFKVMFRLLCNVAFRLKRDMRGNETFGMQEVVMLGRCGFQ